MLDSRLGRDIIMQLGAEKSRARIMHAIEIRIVIHNNYVNKNKTDTLLWLAGKNQLQDTTTTKKICIVARSAVRTYAGDREWLNARGKI